MAGARKKAAMALYEKAKKRDKPGEGGRFKALSKAVGSPALAAWIGRKKYGAKKMASMAAKGRKA
jgi:hypothetical protein